jgi:Fe-Mn family superoxide dismutase
MTFCKISNQTQYPFVLPSLPYADTALEPVMSSKTFSFHHQKHHNAYVVNLNKLIEGSDFAKMDLESIIVATADKVDKAAIFNNAAQVWNHTFFWNSMSPSGGGKPSANLLNKINEDFGSFEAFCESFKSNGISQFGSGWVWLVQDKNSKKLSIVKTSNANSPITSGYNPLITCDVWEHAYYIDFQNKRPDFLSVFLEKLVNWNFASERLLG